GGEAVIRLLLARERVRRRAAFEMDLSLAPRRGAVLEGECKPARLGLRELQLLAEGTRDALAKLDRIALGFRFAHEREGNGAFDVAERDRAALPDLVDGRRLREAGACGEEECEER